MTARRTAAALAGVVLLAAAGCGPDPTGKVAELEAEMEELAERLEEAKAAAATTTTPPDACAEWWDWGWPDFQEDRLSILGPDQGLELRLERLDDGHPYSVDDNRGCVGRVGFYRDGVLWFYKHLAVCVGPSGSAYASGDIPEEAYKSCQFVAS